MSARVPLAAADALAAASDRLGLDGHPYWHLLLHCRRGLRGVESRVDDPAFFAAPDGKRNPRAELHAMLRAMVEPAGADDPAHPLQRFPARAAWLREQLGPDAARLPPPPRTRFDLLWEQMKPVSATLAFPACHLNNPASMFGHTLIVFDSQDRNRLLSQSVSYAGRTDGGFSPLFLVGCFVGSFPGYYSIMPYHEKVELYGDIGYRDIWEYELDLGPDELRRMLLHTWELQGVRSDYYFLTENCALNLLYLIDAARPSLKLTRGYRPWVTPLDVVKRVSGSGLVRHVAFRPSKVTTLRCLAARLSADERRLARAAAVEGLAAEEVTKRITDPDRQVMALDLASQFVQYRYTERAISPDTYRRRLLPILNVRSRVGCPSDAVYRVPEPSRPDVGHDGNRVALGIGSEGGDSFQCLRYRPAYHAADDPGAGFDPGFQMEFLDVEVRREQGAEAWTLDRLDAIDILSIAPCDRFLRPMSWQASAGLGRRRADEDDNPLIGRGRVGLGYAAGCGGHAMAYALLDARAEVGSAYPDHWVLGGGPSTGLILGPFWRWKAVLQGEGAWLAGRGEAFTAHRLSLLQSLALARNHSLGLEGWESVTDGYRSAGAAVLWNVFF